MPYSTLDSLPDAVKKLGKHLQEIWRATFNSALEHYKDETRAFKIAWAAVNKQREDLHPHFQRIKKLFLDKYGEMGLDKYLIFLERNSLDPSLSYRPSTQGKLRESFEWAKPALEFFKKDAEAKYYKVNCLDAIVSFNENDYSDYDKMIMASSSMNYRPVNINHDTNRWMRYPRTRLDYSKAEDFTVEGILRVDNQDEYLQKQLDHDPTVPEAKWIWHPSIEGRPNIDGIGYHFTGIALLEQGYRIPGDPLSEIAPLFTESVNGVCTFIEGVRICLEDESKVVNKMSEQQQRDKDANKGIEESMTSEQILQKIIDLQKQIEKTYDAVKPTVEKPENYLKRELLRTELTTWQDALRKDVEGESKIESTKVEHAKFKVEVAETILSHQKKEELLNSELLIRNEKIAILNEELAKANSMKGQFEAMKVQVAEAAEKIAKEQSQHIETKNEVARLTGVIRERNDAMTLNEKRLSEKETKLNDLKIELSQVIEEAKTVRGERAEALEKSAASTQKSIHETQERSRIQFDNAKLREDAAKLTREISDLTTKISEDSKRLLSLERELSDSKTKADRETTILREQLEAQNHIIEKAKKFQKWTYEELKKAGVVVVNDT